MWHRLLGAVAVSLVLTGTALAKHTPTRHGGTHRRARATHPVHKAPARWTKAVYSHPHTPRVVVDPGHGGYDSGAVGPRHVREKTVTLAIATLVQQILEARGVETIMTRKDDSYVSLNDRTALANRFGADAFVSIHANSARNKKARGIETYTLNTTSDRYAIRLAAIENQTSEKQVSDLQLILADLSTKANSAESVALARRVQRKMMVQARTLNRKTRDLGVKASLFYVLLGARMPSILVETSFISNADEARLLNSGAYQRKLATAIADALTEHLNLPMHVVKQ